MMTTWDNSYWWWWSPPEIVCKVPPGEVGCCGRAQFIPWATVQCILNLCGVIKKDFLTHSSSCREQCSWRCTRQTGWCRRTLQIPPLPIWYCICLILLWIILIVPKRQKMRNLSERLKNLFWSLFITMIDLITKLLSCRIIPSGCINTWRWSDQRLPWRSHQTASLSDTPSRSLECPR